MVLRDLGLGKSTPVVTLDAKRPQSEELLLLAGATPLNAEDTTLYRFVAMRVEYKSLDRQDLLFAAGSLARGLNGATIKRPRAAQTCWRLLEGTTSWSSRA